MLRVEKLKIKNFKLRNIIIKIIKKAQRQNIKWSKIHKGKIFKL